MKLFAPEPPPDMAISKLHPAKRPFMSGLVTLLPADTVNNPLTNPIDYAGWNLDCISGYRWRAEWDTIQPTSQRNYDWDNLDRFVDLCARYGKHWSISVASGLRTPQWVYDAGVTPYTTLDGNGIIPVFWESLYLELFFEFLEAFNARYGADPLFRMMVPSGFSQGNQLYTGSDADEDISTGMPHVGYADVPTAWTAAAQAVLTKHLTVFGQINFALGFNRPFPSDGVTGVNLKNWFNATAPVRGGLSVSALFAIRQQDYTPTITSTYQNGFQAFLDNNGCCLKPDGTVNPDVYKNPPGPPVPLPPYPQTFKDLCVAALTKGGMYLEIYQAEIKDSRTLSAMQQYDPILRANVPPFVATS